MKRLFLRIFALVTVVVLGLIAIAQAQRATERPRFAEASTASREAPTSEGVPPSIIAPANSGIRPRAATAGLGPPPARQFRGDQSGDNPSAEALATDTGPAAPPANPGPDQQRRIPLPADPFNLRAYRPGPPSSAMAAEQVIPGSEQAPNVVADGASQKAGRVDSQRDSRLPLLPATAQPTLVPAMTRSGQGAIVPDRRASVLPRTQSAERYASPQAEIPEKGEPAPFSVDPLTAPAKISQSPGAGQGERPPSAAGPAAIDAAPSVEGTGQPGKKQLEGPQVPQLTIQKFAPEAIQVGKPAAFRITVVNTGQVTAHGVEIRDQVPKGTQLMATKPRASRGASGELVWDLGTLKPGDDSSVELQLIPVAEGEIGSVATVCFHADASARTTATKPELVIRAAVPNKVLIGEEVTFAITVSNPGSGVATGVMLEERIPAGLQHPAGTELEYEIGTLKPGESRQLQLVLSAARPGPVTNLLTARGDGNLKAEDRLDLEVVAPQLDLAMDGPKRRYLEREATYTVSVSNPGTAPARQVELVAYLPHGLRFVSANNYGHYEAATQTVHWLLEELPANESDKVELVTLPIEPGEQKLRFQGKAERGLSIEKEQPISVEGIAAIRFEVVDVDDPIKVGGETTYEIRVLNQGSKAATNVRVVALLPPEMRAVAAEGPTRQILEAGRVQFETLARLAPKAETTYRVRVQGLQPGDLRIRVQLLADEMQDPVTKEESTRVYSDE